ncbi:hypothetical protein BU17DRAFT_96504 [Hysterangium stoloniferum]|nr:hypothetical protein BU17DRAFT_96504 [Hysterangium stoloniferum]
MLSAIRALTSLDPTDLSNSPFSMKPIDPFCGNPAEDSFSSSPLGNIVALHRQLLAHLGIFQPLGISTSGQSCILRVPGLPGAHSAHSQSLDFLVCIQHVPGTPRPPGSMTISLFAHTVLLEPPEFPFFTPEFLDFPVHMQHIPGTGLPVPPGSSPGAAAVPSMDTPPDPHEEHPSTGQLSTPGANAEPTRALEPVLLFLPRQVILKQFFGGHMVYAEPIDLQWDTY